MWVIYMEERNDTEIKGEGSGEEIEPISFKPKTETKKNKTRAMFQ
jgi:hypothetical protein